MKALRGRASALLLAALIDALLGEPPARLHPVVWMGRALSAVEPLLLRGSARRQLLAGALVTLGGASACLVLGTLLDRLLARPPGGWLLHAWLLKGCLAWRALDEAAGRVQGLVAAGDLASAREALRALVSRDPTTLDREQIVAAGIESVAENFSDSLVAPLLAFLVAGLGGALAYRWLNTADAMIGYRGHYEWAGKVAARLDDVANFLPARLAAGLLLVVAPSRRGVAVLWRDHAQTASPNAGWPMAAMAGLLDRALEKPGHYRLNAAAPLPDLADLATARAVVARGWLLALALAIFGERRR
ncbi:MAG: adenosylcobinamide-phosphate synthase CbiB [Chloroflexi bacterium]|nr:adenosylcobinamide-phosphate synthase CbiB [Chloroflexota bacterium]GIW10435.1 MAG: cobalamin biosynthesis protein CobD [Dehalococcoidia bacterium]